ncbi:MAG: CsbD family protein [Solirubrobacteraceae bacterium]
MTDKHIDEAKGRLKQAAGSLTDDHDLRNEGKADQAKATLKDKVDKAIDALTSRDKS